MAARKGNAPRRKLMAHLSGRRELFGEIVSMLAGADAATNERLKARGDLIEMLSWNFPLLVDRPTFRRAALKRQCMAVEEHASTLALTFGRMWAAFDELNRHVGEHSHVLFKHFDFSDEAQKMSTAMAVVAEFRNAEYDDVVAALAAIQTYCEAIRARVGDDSGGQTDLWTEGQGNPKRKLVGEAALLFASYGHRVTANEGGEFAGFCAALYELLTDEDPEGRGAGLRRYVAWATPKVREIVQIQRILAEHGVARGPSYRGKNVRLLALDKRLTALHRELHCVPTPSEDGPNRTTRRTQSLRKPV